MYLFVDTETTGVPAGADYIHMVEIAWILGEENGNVRAQADFIIKPDGFVIPEEIVKVHGISQERALAEGQPLEEVLCAFTAMTYFPVAIVGHDIGFDVRVLRKELERVGWEDVTHGKELLCTMRSSTDLCDIPRRGGGLKAPRLAELYRRLFDCDFEEAHHARPDIEATWKCFWELRKLGVM